MNFYTGQFAIVASEYIIFVRFTFTSLGQG